MGWRHAVLRLGAVVDDFEPLDMASDEESPEAIVSRLSDAKSLKRCLDLLEPVRRNAIVLAYVNGLTHGEIAGKLGVPLGTAKAWIRRSLLALSECLA